MKMESIEALVKGDFAGILTFKRRGETLEVITPYSMSNNDVVSVFVTERDGEFVCTVEIGKEMRDRAGRKAWNALLKKFGVKKNLDTDWFYKKTDDPKCVASCIYDLANYAMAVSYVMYGVPRPCNFDRYHSAKQFLSDYCDDSMLEFCQIVWEDRVQGALDGVASDFIRAIEYLFMKNLNEKGGSDVSGEATTYKGTLATLEEFRAWIAGCDLVIAGRVRAREAFLRRDEVEKFIDRIDAAADRDRRAMQCTWEPGSVASIVRQMEDAATDLRNTDPRVAENLRYYADQLKATHAAKTGTSPERSSE